MLVVLDSTVLIDFLRGRPVVERIIGLRRRGVLPATTAVNVEEIVRGLHAVETGAARQLFAGLVVLPVDAEVAWQAGQWRRDHAARGITLYQADCLIAAATVLSGGVLATGDVKDFPMADLQVEHWPVGR